MNGVRNINPVLPDKRFVPFTLLIGMLLLVQTEGLWHHLDLDAHADDHACEFCVGLLSLDHGVPGAIQPFLPLEGVAVPLPTQQAPLFFPLSITAYLTRAPPHRLIP